MVFAGHLGRSSRTHELTQVATDTLLEIHLLFFIEKRSGPAAVRSVGNRGDPVCLRCTT